MNQLAPIDTSPRPQLVAVIPMRDGHSLKVHVETRRGKRQANIRLWRHFSGGGVDGRTTLATRRAIFIEAEALPALAEALTLALANIVANGGEAE